MALEGIHRGKRNVPPRLMLYGTEGIGKSTFASQAPAPIFVKTEDGLNEIACDSFPLAKSAKAVADYLDALLNEKHSYRTLVVDSLDWLERLVWDELCESYGVSCIEKVDGGYAKGYTHALRRWREFIDKIDRLRNQFNMAVVFIAHAKIEKFEDPEGPSYDRYSPRLHKHVGSLVVEWCDSVFFATRKTITTTEDAGFGKKRGKASAIGGDGGERYIRTVGGPSCVAKNRYGLPPELPLSWPAFMAAFDAARNEKTQPKGESR